MSTKKKSDSIRFLEKLTGGPLTLGRFIRSIRLGEDASQQHFSKQLGISIQHLSDIENGRRVVSPARAAKFATALGYSETQFVELAIQDMLNQAGLEKLKVKVS